MTTGPNWIDVNIKSHLPGASRAEDETKAKEAAAFLKENADLHMLDDNGNWLTNGEGFVLFTDVEVPTTKEVIDAEGNLVSARVLEEGFFINMRVIEGRYDIPALSAAVAQFGVTLATPVTPAQGWLKA